MTLRPPCGGVHSSSYTVTTLSYPFSSVLTSTIHALVSANVAKNIYVYWADTSDNGNLSTYNFLEALDFPDGTEEMVDRAGT